MKNQSQKFWKVLSSLTCLGFLLFYTNATAQEVCDNDIDSHGGFTYEYWKDQGTGCMTLGEGGTFSVEWNNINNLLARKGIRPGSMNQTVTYDANYQPNGNSYLCVYGWTTGPLVEYYIVDSWGTWRPPGGEGFMGQVNSDGGTYDIYRTLREEQPSIEGTATFYQFWSVRTSKRTGGTITVANHFNAWQNLGMNMGNLYEVSLTIEGYQSSGTADILSMSMGTSNGGGDTGGGDNGNGGDNGGPGSQGDGEYTVTVRARGTVGGEHLNVLIDNQAQADINLSTSWQEYEVFVNRGDLSLEYDNDEGDLDVQVDWVEVHGETRQAEDQEVNTAVYQDDSCGGSFSEMMHCSGLIDFGDITFQDSGDNGETECNGYYALSFDDGPNNNTSILLGILDNAGVKATFFPGGNQISGNIPAFQAMVNAGHRIENHSYTHSHMLNWSYQQVFDDIQQAQQAIQNAGGGTPTLFRPPYGEVNGTISAAANDLGLTVVIWDVDTEDWNGASTSAIVSSANNIQNGGVFLMHDGYSTTNNAIQAIVNNLSSRGLCAGSINDNGNAVEWAGGVDVGDGNNGEDNGSGNITVRARGVEGGEIIDVQVNGATVDSFTLSASYEDYSVSGNGTVRVEFTNDEGDRDVQVDYITVDGVVFQAEDQEINTAVYQGDSCGGSFSEMMHCGGYIEFGSNNDNGGGDDCEPSVIAFYVNINNSTWDGMTSISVDEGDSVEIGPQPEDDGSWSWTGPNGYTNSSRVVTINSATPNDEGIYTAVYVNDCGEESTNSIALSVTVPEDNGDDNGNGNIVVTARGVEGGETIDVLVNGVIVDSFTLSASYEDYSVTRNGTVRVEFTNDEGGRDVQVDYITVDGVVFQAEDQEINTAVYQDDSCGGSFSEMMHCSGYIEFGPGEENDGNDSSDGEEEEEEEEETGSCSELPTWSPNDVYGQTGTQVVYNGIIYQNNWYTSNQNPEENSGQWQVWTFVGSCQVANLIAEAKVINGSFEVSENEFKIYPNPSIGGAFFIQNSSVINKLIVFNLNGKIVKQIEVKQNEIHLSGIARGEYIIHIYTEEKMIVKKVVVN